MRQRLQVRGDTFLDSNGELFAQLKVIGTNDPGAGQAVAELEHRRSEKTE